MCAVVAGQSEFAQHSLLTGEENLKTLLVQATDLTPLSPPDAMATVSHLLPTFEGERCSDAIGKIRAAADPSVVRCLGLAWGARGMRWGREV
jgi:hypothetical protein